MYPLGCRHLLALRRAAQVPPGPVCVILDRQWRHGLEFSLALPTKRRAGELDWSPLSSLDVVLVIDGDVPGSVVRETVLALSEARAGAVFVVHRELGVVAMPRNPWLAKR